MTKREEELISQGWERRFVASEPRLSEVAELYDSIGFDVLLDPMPTEEEVEQQGGCSDGECRACFEVGKENYRIVYTRAKAGTIPS
jgi:hypothetical protein